MEVSWSWVGGKDEAHGGLSGPVSFGLLHPLSGLWFIDSGTWLPHSRQDTQFSDTYSLKSVCVLIEGVGRQTGALKRHALSVFELAAVSHLFSRCLKRSTPLLESEPK